MSAELNSNTNINEVQTSVIESQTAPVASTMQSHEQGNNAGKAVAPASGENAAANTAQDNLASVSDSTDSSSDTSSDSSTDEQTGLGKKGLIGIIVGGALVLGVFVMLAVIAKKDYTFANGNDIQNKQAECWDWAVNVHCLLTRKDDVQAATLKKEIAHAKLNVARGSIGAAQRVIGAVPTTPSNANKQREAQLALENAKKHEKFALCVVEIADAELVFAEAVVTAKREYEQEVANAKAKAKQNPNAEPEDA